MKCSMLLCHANIYGTHSIYICGCVNLLSYSLILLVLAWQSNMIIDNYEYACKFTIDCCEWLWLFTILTDLAYFYDRLLDQDRMGS